MRLGFLRLLIVLALIHPTAPVARGVPAPANIGNPPAPERGMAEYAQGLDQLAAFDLARAETSFAAALKQSPNNVEFVLAHGMSLLLNRDRIEEGQRELEQALRMSENPDRQVLNMHAFSLYLANDRIGGRRRFERIRRTPFEELVRTVGEEFTFGESRRQGSIRRFPEVARGFAEMQQQSVAMSKHYYARGMQKRVDKDFLGACVDLARVLEQYPDDWTLRFYYATALCDAGDFESARRELSMVLRRESTVMPAYAQRAIAAARMGNLRQAKQDLALASQFDPTDRYKLQEAVRPVIDQFEAAAPKTPAPQLFAELLDGARKGQSIEQLTPLAKQLITAAHSTRVSGEETYQERLRPLQWAVIERPKDPKALAALGRFLLDEIDVRGEYVDPGMNYVYYRVQTKAMQAAEIEAARERFTQALAIDPDTVPALMGMAEIKYRENLFGDAENYVTRAMALRPNDPFILDMMAKLMRIAASQQLARAMAALTPDRWTEYRSNERVHYVRYPSAADYAAADQFGRNADGMLARRKDYIQRALQALKDTPESYDYLGTLAFERKEYEAARAAYVKAVEKLPGQIEYRYGLANAYARLNQFDPYLQQTTIGRGLEQTSAAGHLLGAWQRIVGREWAGASDLLNKAIAVDPGDSRIPAYMGAVAEGQDRPEEALACFRAALAMEEANASNRGSSYADASGLWTVDAASRTIALRMRMARLIELKDPKGAAELYAKNLLFERRLTSRDMLTVVPSGMLPEGRTSLQPRNTTIGGLLQTNRSLLAVALYDMGQYREAADQFRALSEYERHVERARRNRNETLGGGMWTTRNVAQTAVDCFTRIGDSTTARLWERQVRTQISEEPAAPQRPPVRGWTTPPGGGGRRQ